MIEMLIKITWSYHFLPIGLAKIHLWQHVLLRRLWGNWYSPTLLNPTTSSGGPWTPPEWPQERSLLHPSGLDHSQTLPPTHQFYRWGGREGAGFLGDNSLCVIPLITARLFSRMADPGYSHPQWPAVTAPHFSPTFSIIQLPNFWQSNWYDSSFSF